MKSSDSSRIAKTETRAVAPNESGAAQQAWAGSPGARTRDKGSGVIACTDVECVGE